MQEAAWNRRGRGGVWNGQKTEGQGEMEMELGTKGVPEVDSVGAQNGKAQSAEQSKAPAPLHQEYMLVFKTGSHPGKRQLY